MPNKKDLLEQVIDNLFKLSDKSEEKYNFLLKKFNLNNPKEVEKLSLNKLEELLKLSNSSLNFRGCYLYPEKNFEQDLKNILVKQALKLSVKF
jgi:hypothetical protein